MEEKDIIAKYYTKTSKYHFDRRNKEGFAGSWTITQQK
jgi:hypothetical protein